MYGIFYKDVLLGKVEIKKQKLVFYYVENVEELSIPLISHFPEIKEYAGTEVFSFILNRLNLQDARGAKNIKELIDKAGEVAHSPITIKRIS